MSQTPSQAAPAPRHDLYVPRYAAAKLAMAALGVVLVLLSLQKLLPVARLAVAGGSVRAEAVRIVRIDSAGHETAYASDAELLTAVKAVEDARDSGSSFWVEFRFTTADGKDVRARSPLGQRLKPLQQLKDRDGLSSTALVWYDKKDPSRIALPLELGTWFMPGMLVLFGGLGIYMGLMLWWHANRPVEMPDLSRSHAEKNNDN